LIAIVGGLGIGRDRIDMVIKERLVEIVRIALLKNQGKTEVAATGNNASEGGSSLGCTSNERGNCDGLDKSEGRDEGGKAHEHGCGQFAFTARNSTKVRITGKRRSPSMSAFQSGRVRGASRRPSAGGAATLRAASRRSAAKEPRAATGSQGAKQRDVPGVRWVPVKQCWITRWWEGAVNKVRTFSVRKYMAPGKTREEAKAEALRDAIALRKELVRTGKLKVKKTVLGSRIQGVHWNRARKGWQVRIMSDGKYLSGGYFRPKDNTPDEIERARLAAVERRRTLEHEHGVHEEAQHTSQLVEHDSGILGVTWSRFESQWHVQIALNGKKVNRRFRPKDDTLEEIERARLAAVQCRQDLERQKAEQVAAEPGGGCARP